MHDGIANYTTNIQELLNAADLSFGFRKKSSLNCQLLIIYMKTLLKFSARTTHLTPKTLRNKQE